MNELSSKRFVIVGFFVFVGLIIFGVAILIVGNMQKAFEKKIEVVTLFDDVSGLKKGNNIWLSGVKVGIVSNMAFYGNSKVKVTMQIEERAEQFIPADSKVKISSDGLIGNRILVIYGGTENSEKISEGDTLTVEKTFSSEDMMNTLQKSNENLLAITGDLRTMTQSLTNGEGTLGKLLTDDALYSSINSVASSLQKTMDKAQQTISSLNSFTARLNQEGTLLNDLTTDTTLFSSLKTSVLELQQVADTASLVISGLKSDLNNPNSSIGVLLNDEKTGGHLKETIRNLESSSKKLDEDLEALKYSSILKKYFRRKAKAKAKGN